MNVSDCDVICHNNLIYKFHFSNVWRGIILTKKTKHLHAWSLNIYGLNKLFFSEETSQ